MKLISNFKDYYDNAASYGIDDTVRYIRHIKDFQLSDNEYKESRRYLIDREDSTFRVIIGFCGVIYPCMLVKDWEATRSMGWRMPSAAEYRQIPATSAYYSCYTPEHIASCVRTLQANSNRRNTGFYINSESIRKIEQYAVGTQRFFDNVAKDTELLEIFHKYETPVFSIIRIKQNWNSPDTLRLNPFLDEFQFQKVKNPVEAFQQITAYISGVLGTSRNPVVTISDKDQVYKKGFDPKYGFRKRPEAA